MKNYPKVVNKSVEMAYSLFPQAYALRTKYQTFHFCFSWQKRQLLAIGQNNPKVESAKARKLAVHFNNKHKQKYSYLCAETDCIARLWGKIRIDSGITLVVIRLNKHLQFKNSKPCKDCQAIIRALGITKVWYSTTNQEFVLYDFVNNS